MSPPPLSRADVVRHRFHVHGLDRAPGTVRTSAAIALADLGIQDSGPDGAPWALALRGAAPAIAGDLVYAWTLRGSPHAYRRADVAAVTTATAPLSEADAARRVLDAARPLKTAGIRVLDALEDVARHLREIVTAPTGKGEVSRRLTDVVGRPFVRHCRPCNATHVFEMPFRLAALQAGLELEPGTSPPVLRRIPRQRPAFYRRTGGEASPRFDVIRNVLRFSGPATERDVAEFIDAPLQDVRAAWPDDAVEVAVRDDPGTAKRYVLADVELGAGPAREPVVRLLGPFDPYLQLRDRELLVTDEARRRDLWRTLGRPGAVVRDGEVVGTWRTRTARGRLTVVVDRWGRWDRALAARSDEQAERLAAHRGVDLAAVERP